MNMETKELYLYKVSALLSKVYVAAENQREAVLKVKDNEVFKDIDNCQLSVTFIDMVTT